MMKRLVLILALLVMQVSAAFAATQIKVIATEDFKTDKPSEYIDVIVPEESVVGEYTLATNSRMHCKIIQVVEPKRGKRNAGFYVQPVSYTHQGETTDFEEEIYAKYSSFVLSAEELKKIPPFKIIKSAALSVGNYFVKGLKVGYSFAEGIVKNEEGNRFKSGAKNAYEESVFSFIGEGQQLDIKVGDEFYLVFSD